MSDIPNHKNSISQNDAISDHSKGNNTVPYRVETLPSFDKQLKRLAKKYPSLKAEYSELIGLLEKNPSQGTPIGHDCFKLRLAIASKGKGKSGGARVIYFVQVSETLIILLSIYDKSEQENISDKDLQALMGKFIL